ncbi:trypsin-like serine peptidase [Rufibacter latericius]|uniref:Serine protease n=1 Tax=Rufibacter latericius TaxID=2487040 RepID=A0A3M9ME06_9BACT|nr:serine protease [Rufibacter latericius]RNI23367.1 serine protease [Rufibacter latericius]
MSIKIAQLTDVLSDLVPNETGVFKYIRDAGLKPQNIRLQGSVIDMWSETLNEAKKHNKVNDIVSSVLKAYPDNPFLLSALELKEVNYALSPDIDDVSTWNGVDRDTLEKLTFDSNTLLPINFLERGIIASRSVAKVEIKYNGYVDVGTGFLFRVAEDGESLFATNYHVINNKDRISSTRIIFNFEQDTNGDSKASKSFKIDEGGPWLLSPVNDLDVCIFKLDCLPAALEEFGYLLLSKSEVKKNDYVNIIQHPAGQMKQISLYHNIVTYCDDRVVQYLTDTLRGSSGAPVFNSDWKVVALHHSGGNRKNNEDPLPFGAKFRNEGIQINRIIDFVQNASK